MKRLISLGCMFTLLIFTSCQSNNTAWENVKTAGRYVQKSIDSLWGKEHNSEWVQNEEDNFMDSS